MENELKNLAVQLFEINAVKFGSFVTKAGLHTPVYFDLRVIISHPQLMKSVSNLLWSLSTNETRASQICGVPYTALPIATLISVEAKIPMVIRRKEAKTYGTKKLIEGQFAEGETCVIVEDVVTTGSSILETLKDLIGEGLKVEEAIVILDREQGGRGNLEANNIRMRSLYTLTSLMRYLLDAGKVTPATVEQVQNYLEQNQVKANSGDNSSSSRLRLDYATRAKLAKNPAAAKLFELMSEKRSNLCLAVDLTSADAILELAAVAGPHIAVLKTHVDAIENFTDKFIEELRELAKKHNFLIMEDRKFADIGHTVSLQYRNGIYKIAEWADFVTAHTVSGSGVISGLQNGLKGIPEDRGIFLVTEMSSEGAFTTGDYVKNSILLSGSSKLVAGLVCQSDLFDDPGLVQLTPGVRLNETSDSLGQRYKTPQSVIDAGTDLAVVGRGVTEAKDRLVAVVQYKEKLWQAYINRISQNRTVR